MVPVGLDALLEEREAEDALFISCFSLEVGDYLIDGDEAFPPVEEVVLKVAYRKGLPYLPETDNVPEPGDLLDEFVPCRPSGLLEVARGCFVLLPEYPLRRTE